MRMAFPPSLFQFIGPVCCIFKLRPNEKEISHGRVKQLVMASAVGHHGTPGTPGHHYAATGNPRYAYKPCTRKPCITLPPSIYSPVMAPGSLLPKGMVPWPGPVPVPGTSNTLKPPCISRRKP